MTITEIKEKSVWEDFLSKCEEKTFLQSWNWGEFQERMGNKIWRIGLYNDGYDGYPISIILAVKIKAKRGAYLLVQHGPIIQNSNLRIQNYNSKFKIFETITNKLKEIAKTEHCSLIRIASLFERNEENKKMFRNLGFREAPMHANAYEATWKLDITPSEEELLKNMRKSTRYLIHQAQKNNGIEIFQSQKKEDVDFFDNLLREVAKTQHFVPFSTEYAKNEFSVFNKDNQISLFLGKYQGKIVAGAFVVFWSNIGFYHQAALLSKYHKIPVAYLLQWAAIKEAKKRGCKLYDFWGYVDPKSRHPWAGPTLFKIGFGGKTYEYVKTQDLPLSQKYWLTFIFEKLRKIKRGL